MSKPVQRFEEILDEILGRHDLSHDFGRKEAHEAAIDYAREHLLDDPRCDDFLESAANRLGFAPVSLKTIEARVKLPRGAWLDLWISDQDDEIALTGTTEGLQYMIDVLRELMRSKERGEHVHLDRAYLPLTESSANLVIFREEESWFTGAPPGDGYEDYERREIEPKSIYAIQFIHFPPIDLPMTANRLYRVLGCEEDDGESPGFKELLDADPSRYVRFRFIGDDGNQVDYTFHLDDPGVNYFTHREIVSLALKPV